MKTHLSMARAVLILSLLTFPVVISQALAMPPGGHLSVSEVFVDNPTVPTTLLIHGDDFLHGPHVPVVTLGDYGPLNIVGEPTNNLIYALLPPSLSSGDYLLTVSTGQGQSQNADYDFTLSPVGIDNIGACGDSSAIQEIFPDGSVSCEQFMTPTSSGDITLKSTSGKIVIKAGASQITMQQDGTITIEGNNVNIKSNGNLNLSGAVVDINGSAMVDVDGGLIMLN